MIFLPLVLVVPNDSSGQSEQGVNLVIHLRGVFESKITLLGKTDSRLFKPIKEIPGVLNGQTASLIVPRNMLPGEFVIRFDYKEKEGSNPYPSEKFFIVNDQDLELWVSPVYCNNSDSTWFQANERENRAYARFSEQSALKKEQIGILMNFLMNYDDPGSDFYQQAIREFEKRRSEYNQWLSEYRKMEKELFVSNVYSLEYIPEITWSGSENDRRKSLIAHYFDGVDFSDPRIIKVSGFSKWIDNYVNLYGEMATTVALRDSLFPIAGITAIEKAKKGDPMVYGWMVDYFYKGYESNGIDAGIKILEPYLNDPNCLTSKRIEISRRLEGIKRLTPGTVAPEIRMTDVNGNQFDLYKLETGAKYILLLFWSAGCTHCVELADMLYPWNTLEENANKMKVIAISLDEGDPDIQAWKQKISSMTAWTHLGDPEGVRSKVAGDYFVLSTPVMFFLDGKTKEIRAIPATMKELMSYIKK